MKVLTIDYKDPQAPSEFCQSLMQTGFAVIKNHPIPINMIQDFYHIWQQFFISPNKQAYLYHKSTQTGYFPFRTEKAKDYTVSDLKEFYHFFYAAEQAHPPSVEAITRDLFQRLNHLAVTLLQWIETALPMSVAANLSMPLHRMIYASPNTLLRILHYPPIPDDIEQEAVRAAPHEDINLITLLPAATAPGLEVKDSNQEWHPVTCDLGQIVVNVGDMLQECTNHYFISTTHRVVNPTDQNEARLSAPFFLHPAPEVPLSQRYTAGQYLLERLKEIGLY